MNISDDINTLAAYFSGTNITQRGHSVEREIAQQRQPKGDAFEIIKERGKREIRAQFSDDTKLRSSSKGHRGVVDAI